MHDDTRFQPDFQQPNTDLLLWAYQNAIFPMADPLSGVIHWYSPDPRGVIPLERDGFNAPASLRRLVRRADFDIRCDTAFADVMRGCARPRSPDNLSWMNQPLFDAYLALHEHGYAHSIEAWRDDRLVGGLYGVHINAAFFGESMFVVPGSPAEGGGANASKVCLVHLVRWLRQRGFTLLDTQFLNPHLARFGCIEISRDAYLDQLADALAVDVTWGRFSITQGE